MKKLSTLLLAIALASCGWDMDAGAWHRAESFCRSHGGVVAADHNKGSHSVRALCMDGADGYAAEVSV